jgi:hypothetical protein
MYRQLQRLMLWHSPCLAPLLWGRVEPRAAAVLSSLLAVGLTAGLLTCTTLLVLPVVPPSSVLRPAPQDVKVMVADKAREASCVALAALVAALQRQRQKAVLRWVGRDGQVGLAGLPACCLPVCCVAPWGALLHPHPNIGSAAGRARPRSPPICAALFRRPPCLNNPPPPVPSLHPMPPSPSPTPSAHPTVLAAPRADAGVPCGGRCRYGPAPAAQLPALHGRHAGLPLSLLHQEGVGPHRGAAGCCGGAGACLRPWLRRGFASWHSPEGRSCCRCLRFLAGLRPLLLCTPCFLPCRRWRCTFSPAPLQRPSALLCTTRRYIGNNTSWPACWCGFLDALPCLLLPPPTQATQSTFSRSAQATQPCTVCTGSVGAGGGGTGQ